MISFSIPWIPGPKQGDRSRVVRTRTGKQFIAHYQPAEIVAEARSLASLIIPYRPPNPLEGPVVLNIFAFWPFCKSHSKRFRSTGRRPKDTKPDTDNLQKAIMDVMQRTGFFVNDSQVCRVLCEKSWSDRGPMLVIEVGTYDDWMASNGD